MKRDGATIAIQTAKVAQQSLGITVSLPLNLKLPVIDLPRFRKGIVSIESIFKFT
jgi:hypothetical protein